MKTAVSLPDDLFHAAEQLGDAARPDPVVTGVARRVFERAEW